MAQASSRPPHRTTRVWRLMAPGSKASTGDRKASKASKEPAAQGFSASQQVKPPGSIASEGSGSGDEDADGDFKGKFGKRSRKIMLTSVSPDGTKRKMVVKRNFRVMDFRQTIAVMNGRVVGETELRLDGQLLIEQRTRPFEDRDEPYEIHWEPGSRMHNLLKWNNLKSKISRAPGTKGLNRTAVHFAAMNGDIDLAKEVLEDKEVQPLAKELVNAQDTFGDTALHFAAILGFEDIVEFLCDRGAKTEIINVHRRTALMYAAEHGHNDAVRALLHCGASLASTVPNSRVPNAKHLAHLNGRTNVLLTIREHENAAAMEEEFMKMAMLSMEEEEEPAEDGAEDGEDVEGGGEAEYFQQEPTEAAAE